MKKRYNLLVALVFAAFSGYSQTATLPLTEDFESESQGTGSCTATSPVTLSSSLFSNDQNDNHDWQGRSGTTSSSNTGPTANGGADHNPGTSAGKYIYTETSSGCGNGSNVANLESTYMNWTTYAGVKIEFWYHMFGTSMGTMHVDMRVGSGSWDLDIIPSWTDNLDQWQLESISVFDTAYVGKDSVQFRVRSIAGTSFGSDMALDDFSLTQIAGLDLASTALASPTFPVCAGSYLFSGEITNNGTDTITSFNAYFNFNGSLVDSATFTGTLAPGNTTIVNFNSQMVASGSNTLEIYTTNPNGGVDAATGNDTLSLVFSPALAGAFSIDGALPASGTNFQTFADFANTVSNFGVCGPVTVSVAPGVYTTNALLGDIQGTSSTNTITIDGGDSSTTIINGSGGFYCLAFDGASYVTVRNMGFVHSGTSSMAVLLGPNSNNNTIEHCEIRVTTGSTSSLVNPIGSSNSLTTRSTNAASVDSNTVANNHIVGGYYGVYFYGGSGNLLKGNRVLNNQIDSANYYGVYGYYADEMEISGNVMNMTTRNNIQADGIYGLYNTNGIFEGNYIHAPDYGFYISNTSTLAGPTIRKTQIVNNMIVSDSDYGIYLNGVDQVNLYHNSVAVYGPTATSSPAVYLNTFGTYVVDDYDVRNNIFYAANSEAFELTTAVTDTIFTKFDNNIYYTGGATTFIIGTTNYIDLAAYQTANSSYNTLSLQGDPSFFATNDLHIAGTLANDVGDNAVGVATDIDGETRPFTGSNTVDIGADEFSPPLCPPPSTFSTYGITDTSGILTWIGTPGNSFQYEVVTSGSAQGSTGSILGFSAADTALVTGLNPYSLYDFYVREICGRGDTSPWIGPNTFRTLCAPFSAPYYNGFETDATNANAGCWSEYITPYATNANVWVRNFAGVNGPFAGTQALYIYPQSGFTPGSDTLAAVSPQFADIQLGDKQVRFYANTDDIIVQLYVGTSDGTPGSFNALDTISFAAIDTYQEVIVPITTLNGYNGTDTYVVLAHSLPSTTANFDYIRIDEFNYEVMPACPKPQGLGVANLTANSADLVWNSPSGGTSFEVEFGAAGFTQGAGMLSPVTGATTVTMSNLSPATAYEFYVREFCSATDTSVWNGPFGFNTLIQGPLGVNCVTGNQSVLVTEEFNSLASWTGNIGSGTQANTWGSFANSTGSTGTGPNGPHSGTNYIYVETSGTTAGTNVSIVSPAYDLTQVSDSAELSFWMHAFGATIGTLNVNVGTSASGPFSTLFSWSGQLQTAETDPFQQVGVRLDTFVGQTIYVELEYITGASFTSDMAVDLLEISGCISCAIPSALRDSNVTLTSAILNWDENGTATQWELEYGPAGSLPGGGTSVVTASKPYALSGLTPSTAYEFMVRSICGPNDTSAFTSIRSFSTSNGIPYLEDFELFPAGTNSNPFPFGWTSTTTSNPRWESEDASGANENSSSTGPFYDNTNFGTTGGIYMYLETSGGSGSIADLVSPPIYVDTNQTVVSLEFAYHMYGATMGTLNVMVDTNGTSDTVWTLSGQQQTAGGDAWILANPSLAGYQGKSVQIRFSGLSGTSYTSDMSIDDVRLFIPSPADGGVTDILSPMGGCGLSSAATVSVEITNFGTAALSNFPVEYSLNGAPAVVDTYTGTIPAGGVDTFNFAVPVNVSVVGSYTIDAYTVIPNDGDPTNDMDMVTINSIPIVSTMPYIESFESGNAGWTAGGANSSWALGTPTGSVINSAAPGGTNSWVTNLSGNYSPSEGSFVQGPCFDFTNVSQPYFTMDVWWNSEFSWDGANLQTSIDGGATWQNVGAVGDTINWFTDNSINGNPGGSGDGWSGRTSTGNGSNGWLKAEHPLTGLGGISGVLFRINFGSDGSVEDEGFAFDNITISDSIPVGISDNDLLFNEFTLFPNPSNGEFTMTIQSEKTENLTLEVRDLSGKLVYTDLVTVSGTFRRDLDFTSFAKGVYFMQLSSGNSTKVEKLIIK